MRQKNDPKQIGSVNEADIIKKKIKTLKFIKRIFDIAVILGVIGYAVVICARLVEIIIVGNEDLQTRTNRRLGFRFVLALYGIIMIISPIIIARSLGNKLNTLQAELDKIEPPEPSFTQEDMEKIRKRLLKK